MFNITNTSSPEVVPSFSVVFRVFTSTFTILLILPTIVGNVLVIAAFIRFHIIQTVTNYFVVSLACTDLCVALVSMPIWVAYLLTGPQWILGNVLVRIWTMVDLLISTASTMNLMAISFDRFQCITKPLRYYQIVTPTKVCIKIACIWIYSIALAIASLFLYKHRIFNIIAMALCFFVPLLIILAAYTVIFRVALRHKKRIDILRNVHDQRQRLSRRYNFWKEVKAAKTLAVVVGAFIICWTPFAVINMGYSLCGDTIDCQASYSTGVILFAKWLHYGNSLLNPLIYVLMNKDFRKCFIRLIFWRSWADREFAATT